MSDLKNYWNNINPHDVDNAAVEEGIFNIATRIQKEKTNRRRIMAAAVILPLLLFGTLAIRTSFQPNASTIQCYAPMGERKSITLSDGSSVTLNSGSTLIYPDRYAKKSREVILIGEAKFEVSKNPHKPFIVKTNNFDVQVLGTVFNVSAYPEDNTPSVALESGSVKLFRGKEEVPLSPGQLATLDMEKGFDIEQIDISRIMLWTDGGFAFKQAGITDICSYIERTYGVSVQCNTLLPKYKDTSITARRDTQLSLDDFLSLCSALIPDMNYYIENNIITLN